MDAHFRIIAQTFYQVLKTGVSQRDVLVVEVVFTAKDEIFRMQRQFFLQTQLIVEGVKRVLLLAENDFPTFLKLLKIKVYKVACR